MGGKRRKKVLLGFSGGIDSCRSAELLRRQGYDVTALTMDMTGDKALLKAAARSAYALGVDHLVVDVKGLFREKVVDYFAREYISGRTPAPCTVCNPSVKWHVLYTEMLRRRYDHIATGHYFRIVEDEGVFYAAKAEDDRKDQSYYLWMLPQEILRHALTPMAGEIKSDIMAGLPDGSPRESMGVCFLHGMPYGAFLEKYFMEHHPGAGRPGAMRPGNIIDRDGKVVGCHEGAAFYTVGQKKGLEMPEGYYITGIDAGKNILTAGPKEDLFFHNLVLRDVRIARRDDLQCEGIRVVIRGFGHNPEGGCRALFTGERLHIHCGEPCYAPAAGQPAVLYHGDMVIGGGFIQSYS